MKKSLVMILTLVFVMGIAGTAFAANPFSDVPAGHWAYGAINKLVAEGIIDGNGNGTFQGDRTLTRYEVAAIVARAIAREDKANRDQQQLINKLANEYKDELESMNVSIKMLEEKVSKFKVSGSLRLRLDDANSTSTDGNAYTTADKQHVNLAVAATYKVNQDWVVRAESSWERSILYPSSTTSATWNYDYYTALKNEAKQLYATGPIGSSTIKVGKFDWAPAYGLVYNSKGNGAQYSVGTKVKTTVYWGRTDYNDQHKVAKLDWALSPTTNIRLATQHVKSNGDSTVSVDTDTVTKPSVGVYYEGGFDTKLSNDFGLMAAASQSDYNKNKGSLSKAYLTQLKYKLADINVPGSSDIFVEYRKIPTTAVYDRNDAEDYYAVDFKGTRVGFEYVPMQNSKLTAFYMNGKDADTGLIDLKVYRAQMEWFF
ncbi:MAG: S-layer protein [Firmicutes bacterium]|nr:S-layer protein [Bacillota bacterium]